MKFAMKSEKQITPPPISLLHTRYQPSQGKALDSSPVLPISCRAADDKVSPHNDVTYLKVLQINIERAALYLTASQINPVEEKKIKLTLRLSLLIK